MQLMTLNRLTNEMITELGEAMLGEVGKQPAVIALLQRETEGNAFFAVEVVRALAEEVGRLDSIGDMVLPETLLPNGIQDVVARRVGRLSQPARELLNLAAVAGREINLLLMQMLSSDVDVENEWLPQCAETAVLEIQQEHWQFNHDKIREGILADLSASARRTCHKQVAQALEELYGEHPDYAAQLAYHWQKARFKSKERTYSFIAGQLAAEQYRSQEALTHLQRAYELTPESWLIERIKCLLAQEAVYHLLGNHPAQDELLTTIEMLAEQENNPYWLAEVMYRRSIHSFLVGDISRAFTSIQMALENAERGDNLTVKSMAYHSLGSIYVGRGMYAQAVHYYEQGARLHEQANSLVYYAISAYTAGATYTLMGNFVQANQLLDRAIQVLEQYHVQDHLSFALALRALNKRYMGLIAEAEADALRGMVIAEATDNKTGLGLCYMAHGLTASISDRSVAQVLLQKAIAVFKENKIGFIWLFVYAMPGS